MSSTKEKFNNKKIVNSNKKKSKNNKFISDALSEKITDQNISNETDKESLYKKQILLNANVTITAQLGKSKIKIKDFLNFSKGSMLVLDKCIQDSLDIFLNGQLIASGEIVVLENTYGLRITGLKNDLKFINISSEI
ncbi:flagellar motor switch protein FliN [Buchnera aphidicola (Hyadaphis tataricae)]|uniref:Flagellar motor switch protein FliN n=1 Tax=Buchnera aphidicola (Hyadaphis tataricae) TaxID=1241859 RepID=A0A4D6XUD0_9GAMM|nr:FliM/FliN family flagellar motor switch protein [Buchnera aphidicola]QCI21402.1 flagellar motor switch protein FliN [Buchnera aphidicola (Hyadaphis tataricae)]